MPFDGQYVNPVPAQEQRGRQAHEAAADYEDRDLLLRLGRSRHLQYSLLRAPRGWRAVLPFGALIVGARATVPLAAEKTCPAYLTKQS
jgi:hypothetical protein